MLLRGASDSPHLNYFVRDMRGPRRQSNRGSQSKMSTSNDHSTANQPTFTIGSCPASPIYQCRFVYSNSLAFCRLEKKLNRRYLNWSKIDRNPISGDYNWKPYFSLWRTQGCRRLLALILDSCFVFKDPIVNSPWSVNFAHEACRLGSEVYTTDRCGGLKCVKMRPRY